ncbi:MAG TPA: hypothetical protein VLS49_11850 [Usitatibacter sp.]|nr:hypothetical protein [Usitatibacter sp.]
MAGKVRKSSARVTLVLIGVAALSGCGRGDDQRRDVYASREDCLADWGNTPQDCTRATNPGHSRLGYWYGPSYTYHSRSGGSTWTRSSRSIGSTSSHSTRGGFGASGRSSGG